MVSKFSDRSLPKSKWNHQAHLLVGLWHNVNYEFDEALNLVKSKIKAYNISVGTLNTEAAGYHETLTIFWMIVTKTFLLKHPSLPIEDACHLFLYSEKASKTHPNDFYSKDLLFSEKARKSWINGDLQKITLISNDYQLNNHFDLSEEQFEQEFSNCRLAPNLFNHEAHLRLAWIQLKKTDLPTATDTVCTQLTNFVRHIGAEDKFNKTLTVAAVKMVHHFMQDALADNFFDFSLEFPLLKTNFNGLLASYLTNTTVP